VQFVYTNCLSELRVVISFESLYIVGISDVSVEPLPQVIPSPSCPPRASGAKSLRALCYLLARGPAGDFPVTSAQLQNLPQNRRYAKIWQDMTPSHKQVTADRRE